MASKRIKKQIPLGVKLSSIVVLVASIVLFFSGISMLSVGFISKTPEAGLGLIFGPLIMIIALPFIICSIFLFLGKNWARIMMLVLMTLLFGIYLFDLFFALSMARIPKTSDFVIIIISAGLFLYLLLN
ncbi:MAG: hypothetical protein WCP89_03325, partial [archaeon]